MSKSYNIGIDGEGKGRKDHKYILLAASDEQKKHQWYIENENGLSTEDCLFFIINLPKEAKPFAFSFNYDLTKILKDLKNYQIHQLFRPEDRRRKKQSSNKSPWPILWNGFHLNLQGSKFSIRRGKKRKIVWDVFKFYQSKFVSALRDWKVGNYKELEEMERMKNLRSEFDKLSMEEIRKYCFNECSCLAQLVRKLVSAHKDVDIELNKFYGAGTTAGYILDKMDIGNKKRDPLPRMIDPVARAFFGGRFEHSVIGSIKGPVYSYDISSAYPYQCYFLPCLEHGKWQHTKYRAHIENCKTALVRYSIPNKINDSWAPFPYREEDGTIVFPSKSPGGWIWKDEYLIGEKIFPNNVVFHEAYILQSNCECRPFAQIPKYYIQRLKIGKDGAGIILKLGPNGCYGKLAQSIGDPPYQCWIWAGLITSGCRAQALQVMSLHKDKSNLLAVATDGIYTKEEIRTPRARNTGTYNCINVDKPNEGKKPLGGWEKKKVDKGVYFARPGIYFPLNPTEDELKNIRARGIGRAAMMACWENMVTSWELNKPDIEVVNLVRFCGAKSTISIRGRLGKNPTYHRSKSYGQWEERPVILSLNPLPKRQEKVDRLGDYGILQLRSIEGKKISMPYKNSILSLDARQLKQATIEEMEQPDFDFVESWDELNEETN